MSSDGWDSEEARQLFVHVCALRMPGAFSWHWYYPLLAHLREAEASMKTASTDARPKCRRKKHAMPRCCVARMGPTIVMLAGRTVVPPHVSWAVQGSSYS